MADITKRLHYFNHQFLREEDFTDEQAYHMDRRRRHGRTLHTFGVTDGLEITRTGDKEITVSAGTAIDRYGQEIVLPENQVINLSDANTFPANANVQVFIEYHEQESDESSSGGVADHTRVSEMPVLTASTTSPANDGSVIRLASFNLNSQGNVPSGDPAYANLLYGGVRQLASAKIAPGAIDHNELADGAVNAAKIQERGITNANLADNAVDTRTLVNASVSNPKLANNSVNGAKLADGAVSEAKLDPAVRAKLVTNGNNHDHADGDGAQIRHSSLTLDGGRNPHGTTAQDVGALPVTGGTVTGTVTLNTTPTGNNYGESLFASITGEGSGSKHAIRGIATGAGTKYAVSAHVSGNGMGYGGFFSASDDIKENASGSVNAIYATASGDGTRPKTGLSSFVSGNGNLTSASFHSNTSSENGSADGVISSVNGVGTGMKRGVYSQVYGGGTKFGVYSNVVGTNEDTGARYGFYTSVSGGGTKYGVYSGVSSGGTAWAGYFVGNVHVAGTLSKSGGSFLIDHPLDPKNKTLRHSFVESPEDLCLYRGRTTLNAQGKASVKMPDYFAALTEEKDATVTLTPIGKKPFVASYEWNQTFTDFTIYGEANGEVSYLVLANRDDPAMRHLRQPVEQNKGAGYFEKGEYINPEAYGEVNKSQEKMLKEQKAMMQKMAKEEQLQQDHLKATMMANEELRKLQKEALPESNKD